MNFLILGSGGREHAICWKLAHSNFQGKIHCAPGNPLMEKLGPVLTHQIDPTNFEAVKDLCRMEQISVVVVGPEKYLELGIIDYLEAQGIRCVGPKKEGAQLESSKFFAKKLMNECEIPTAKFEFFNDYEKAKNYLASNDWLDGVVIKLDGLASGKGVSVCDNKEDALEALANLMNNNTLGVENPSVIIEERLFGEELSSFALFDGEAYVPFGHACDYKRARDGGTGPNTGGMGAFSPVPWLTADDKQFIDRRIFKPLFAKIKQNNLSFRGVLFAGLIKTKDDIKVLEFNTRFGDPETQTLLPLLEGNFAQLLYQCAHRKLATIKSSIRVPTGKHSVHLVKASENYPGTEGKEIITGREIKFSENLESFLGKDSILFGAGVRYKNNQPESQTIETSGGRVLGVTAVADSLEEAREKAYQLQELADFEGAHMRSDIAKNIAKNISRDIDIDNS